MERVNWKWDYIFYPPCQASLCISVFFIPKRALIQSAASIYPLFLWVNDTSWFPCTLSCSIEKVFGRYWDLANTEIDLNIEARESRVNCNIQVKHKYLIKIIQKYISLLLYITQLHKGSSPMVRKSPFLNVRDLPSTLSFFSELW